MLKPKSNNYLTTKNPFNLPAPPAWWLRKLHDQDAALVLFPSQIRQAYILARRRSHSLKRPHLVELDKALLKTSAGMDGDILADHNLVFVESIVGWGIWTDNIFGQLRARDMWTQGGAEKYADKLDAVDDAKEAKKRANVGDMIDHMARDTYRSYQARTGQRSRIAATSGGRAKQMPIGSFRFTKSTATSTGVTFGNLRDA